MALDLFPGLTSKIVLASFPKVLVSAGLGRHMFLVTTVTMFIVTLNKQHWLLQDCTFCLLQYAKLGVTVYALHNNLRDWHLSVTRCPWLQHLSFFLPWGLGGCCCHDTKVSPPFSSSSATNSSAEYLPQTVDGVVC